MLALVSVILCSLNSLGNSVMQYSYTSTETQTIFENNKFLDNELGLVIADKMHPVCPAGIPCSSCSTTNNINNPIKVKTECNLFDNNHIGMIGSGDIDNQGTTSTSAGNRFQGLTSFGIVDLNIDWGALWQDNNINNKYYYSNWFDFDEPYKVPGSSGQYCMNANTQMASDLAPINNKNILICTAVISRSRTKIQQSDSVNRSSINIYPNPANVQVLIESNLEQNLHFYIYSIQGKMTQEGDVLKGINYINTENLTSGIYIFRFENGDFKKIEILRE
jgi:hypothetical protein